LQYLKALAVAHEGQPVTIAYDKGVVFLTLKNITLAITLRVPVKKVLVCIPAPQCRALKALARKHKTSVNKLILAAIKDIK